jgi:nucleoside-diphosphate-sugar epimerase
MFCAKSRRDRSTLTQETDTMILITGASGNAGGAVLHEVLKKWQRSAGDVSLEGRSRHKAPPPSSPILPTSFHFVELWRASTPFILFARRRELVEWKAT